jgi:hypothetical protein
MDVKSYLLLQSFGSYHCLLSSKHCGYLLPYLCEVEDDYLFSMSSMGGAATAVRRGY